MVTLIPSQNLGIFMSMTGTDYHYYFRNSLQNYIADVYMGETPWLNATTICTFPKPWRSSHKRSVSKTREKRRSRIVRRSVDEYTGTYRNKAYGNIVVTYSTASNQLHAIFGYGRWDLVDGGSDNFYCKWARDPPTLNAKFRFLRKNGAVNAIKIPTFYWRYPPVFFRT